MTVGSFGDQTTRWSSGSSAARRRQFSLVKPCATQDLCGKSGFAYGECGNRGRDREADNRVRDGDDSPMQRPSPRLRLILAHLEHPSGRLHSIRPMRKHIQPEPEEFATDSPLEGTGFEPSVPLL